MRGNILPSLVCLLSLGYSLADADERFARSVGDHESHKHWPDNLGSDSGRRRNDLALKRDRRDVQRFARSVTHDRSLTHDQLVDLTENLSKDHPLTRERRDVQRFARSLGDPGKQHPLLGSRLTLERDDAGRHRRDVQRFARSVDRSASFARRRRAVRRFVRSVGSSSEEELKRDTREVHFVETGHPNPQDLLLNERSRRSLAGQPATVEELSHKSPKSHKNLKNPKQKAPKAADTHQLFVSDLKRKDAESPKQPKRRVGRSLDLNHKTIFDGAFVRRKRDFMDPFEELTRAAAAQWLKEEHQRQRAQSESKRSRRGADLAIEELKKPKTASLKGLKKEKKEKKEEDEYVYTSKEHPDDDTL